MMHPVQKRPPKEFNKAYNGAISAISSHKTRVPSSSERLKFQAQTNNLLFGLDLGVARLYDGLTAAKRNQITYQ